MDPDFAEDPYPFYARLRSDDPVHKSAAGAWVLTRYDDVEALLRDRRVSSRELFTDDVREPLLRAAGVWPEWQTSVIRSALASTLLFIDPPDHTRIRNLVAKAFTPKAIGKLEPRVRLIVDDLIKNAADAQEFDLVSDIAFPLAAAVICDRGKVASASSR